MCADTDVIGVCFYVMGAIDGFTPMGAMPGTTEPTSSGGAHCRSSSSKARRDSAPSTRTRSASPTSARPRTGWSARCRAGAHSSTVIRSSRATARRVAGRRPRRRLARGEPARRVPHRHHPRRLPVRQRDVRARRSPSSRRSSTGSCRRSAILSSTSAGCSAHGASPATRPARLHSSSRGRACRRAPI